MTPCLNLEEAIAQLKNIDERREIEYLFERHKDEVKDKIAQLEEQAYEAEDYYNDLQEAEEECDRLSEQIDDLEAEYENLTVIKAELGRIAGKKISVDTALNTLNKLMEFAGEAKVIAITQE